MDRGQVLAESTGRPRSQGGLASTDPARSSGDGRTWGSDPSRETATKEEQEPIRILLVVCHDGWAILEARAFAAQMADACMRSGCEVGERAVQNVCYVDS